MRRTILLIGFVGLLAGSSATAQDAPPPSPAPDPVPDAAPAPVPAAAPIPAPAAVPAAMMLDEIKIVIDDKAKNDGELRFEFTPEGGTAISIKVTIAKKMSAKDVTEDLAKELKVALGADYKVNRYDADKIEIESKNKKKFHLALASLTAHGLTVRLK
jgi:hypothetical protein